MSEKIITDITDPTKLIEQDFLEALKNLRYIINEQDKKIVDEYLRDPLSFYIPTYILTLTHLYDTRELVYLNKHAAIVIMQLFKYDSVKHNDSTVYKLYEQIIIQKKPFRHQLIESEDKDLTAYKLTPTQLEKLSTHVLSFTHPKNERELLKFLPTFLANNL